MYDNLYSTADFFILITVFRCTLFLHGAAICCKQPCPAHLKTLWFGRQNNRNEINTNTLIFCIPSYFIHIVNYNNYVILLFFHFISLQVLFILIYFQFAFFPNQLLKSSLSVRLTYTTSVLLNIRTSYFFCSLNIVCKIINHINCFYRHIIFHHPGFGNTTT